MLKINNVTFYRKQNLFFDNNNDKCNDSGMILKNINFEVEKGAIVTIVGPNGGGKSTLFKIILNQINEYQGQVTLLGSVGYLPQEHDINLNIPLKVSDFIKMKIDIMETLDVVFFNEVCIKLNFDKIKNKFLNELSMGEMQKLLILRSIIDKPKILLLDEPDKGLDISAKQKLYEIIDYLNKQYNITMLIISHDAHHIFSKTTKVFFLNKTLCCEQKPSLESYEYLNCYVHTHNT